MGLGLVLINRIIYCKNLIVLSRDDYPVRDIIILLFEDYSGDQGEYDPVGLQSLPYIF